MKTKQITRYAILLAIAIILNWVEHIIPLPMIPGVKLGLANAIGMLCLYYLGRKAFISFGFLPRYKSISNGIACNMRGLS